MSNMGNGMHLMKMAECNKKQSISAHFQACGNVKFAAEAGQEAIHLAHQAMVHKASAKNQLALAHMLTKKSEKKEACAEKKEAHAKELEAEGLELKKEGLELKKEGLGKIKDGRKLEKKSHKMETGGLSLFDTGTEIEKEGRRLEKEGLGTIKGAREEEEKIKRRNSVYLKSSESS